MAIKKHVKYGIFWEPEGYSASFITVWKDYVRMEEPSAHYLEHPVHSTIFLLMGELEDKTAIIEALENWSVTQDSFLITFKGWHIFRNDAITGGDTLSVDFQNPRELIQLQGSVAMALVKFRKENVPYITKWQGSYLKSYEKWGFPFCGEHFHPHITVASVKAEGKKVINKALACSTFPSPTIFKNISLYRIESDTHHHIKTIEFRP